MNNLCIYSLASKKRIPGNLQQLTIKLFRDLGSYFNLPLHFAIKPENV